MHSQDLNFKAGTRGNQGLSLFFFCPRNLGQCLADQTRPDAGGQGRLAWWPLQVSTRGRARDRAARVRREGGEPGPPLPLFAAPEDKIRRKEQEGSGLAS